MKIKGGIKCFRSGAMHDAAAATELALSCQLSEAGNIGGGGLCLIRMAVGSGVIDYREKLR
jgi:gamma-glutamyltranspeptidase